MKGARKSHERLPISAQEEKLLKAKQRHAEKRLEYKLGHGHSDTKTAKTEMLYKHREARRGEQQGRSTKSQD